MERPSNDGTVEPPPTSSTTVPPRASICADRRSAQHRRGGLRAAAQGRRLRLGWKRRLGRGAFQIEHAAGSMRLRIFGVAFGGARRQQAARRIVLRLHVMRHAVVGQHLLGNALEDRRRDLAALVQPARRIQNHRNRDARDC